MPDDPYAQFKKPALDPYAEFQKPAEAKPSGPNLTKGDQAPVPDKGFLSTLGDFPHEFMESMSHGSPLDAIRQATDARESLKPLAKQRWAEGKPLPALGYEVASRIPFLGPALASTAQELFNGRPGEGMAHAVEMAAPLAGPKFLRMDVPGAGNSAMRMAGGIKAGVKAAAPDVLAGGAKLAGGMALDASGAPFHFGTLLGLKEGAPQIGRGLRTGIQAGRSSMAPKPSSVSPVAFPDVPPAFPRGSLPLGAPHDPTPNWEGTPAPLARTRTPAWSGLPEASPPAAEASSVTQPLALPSGRKPGNLPWTAGGADDWKGIPEWDAVPKSEPSFDELLSRARVKAGLPPEPAPLGRGVRERWDEGAPTPTAPVDEQGFLRGAKPTTKYLKESPAVNGKPGALDVARQLNEQLQKGRKKK